MKSALTITGKPGARWSERVSADTDRVEFGQGFASFSVRAHGAQRVLIVLPDGELEDRGTIFELEVRDRHTLRVAVHEGRVEVRLQGQASFALKAGES